ncbi:MAG: phosphonopyruvate decarboxylase [Ignavibacteriales bacterium]|nr:phosphonopyruvate decarboxylase [Ignavibacteriales bacterium]
MIKPKEFYNALRENDINFFCGVPDSLLKDICAYITDNSNKNEHIITANEGAAVALASGYHLATTRIPCVYFQNSGLGNTINPLLSLADEDVYGIPILLLIGWRGEPGVKDEPQHFKQGRVQNKIIDALEIPYKIIDENSGEVKSIIDSVINVIKDSNKPYAIIVRKDTFEKYKLEKEVKTNFEMTREDAVKEILKSIDSDDVIVGTTGKTSREVFEYREECKQKHENDFLTVGSMGHASQIALGVSLNSKKKVICLDGDGAVLMHMGSLGIIGQSESPNLLHVVVNNGAHDSVGGQPTLGFNIDLVSIAKACGYKNVFSTEKKNEISEILAKIKSLAGPNFFEIKVNKGARKDLGRPTLTPKETKNNFMNFLKRS